MKEKKTSTYKLAHFNVSSIETYKIRDMLQPKFSVIISRHSDLEL